MFPAGTEFARTVYTPDGSSRAWFVVTAVLKPFREVRDTLADVPESRPVMLI
jgi:hypothetical protein